VGRYYDTETGRSGKFMFGVQPSDDPGFMGMQEQEPSTIQYYADKDMRADIKKNLDKQYDLLDVPKDKRIYYCKDLQDYDAYEKKELTDKVFVSVREDDKEEMEKYKGKIRWADDKPGHVSFEIGKERERTLVLARIRLGITILSDIKDTGECWLNAEL
jgi:hypothetical protein